MKPAYAKAKEKYGADVDAILADAEAVRKAVEVRRSEQRRRGARGGDDERRLSPGRPACARPRYRPGRARRLLPPAPPAPALLALIGDAVDWTIVGIGAMMIVLVFINVVLHMFGRTWPGPRNSPNC